MSIPDMSWMDRASCIGRAGEFDAERLNDLGIRSRRYQAQLLCNGCPVMRQCNLQAQEQGARGVVRGGRTYTDDRVRPKDDRWTYPVPTAKVLDDRRTEQYEARYTRISSAKWEVDGEEIRAEEALAAASRRRPYSSQAAIYRYALEQR